MPSAMATTVMKGGGGVSAIPCHIVRCSIRARGAIEHEWNWKRVLSDRLRSVLRRISRGFKFLCLSRPRVPKAEALKQLILAATIKHIIILLAID